MKKLNMAIPEFKLDRWAKVSLLNKNTAKVTGIDKFGEPFTLFSRTAINDKP